MAGLAGEPNETPQHKDVLGGSIRGDTVSYAHPVVFCRAADDSGNLWLRHYAPPDKDDSQMWSVYDATGKKMADVTLPTAVTIAAVQQDSLLGIDATTVDAPRAVIYKIVRD